MFRWSNWDYWNNDVFNYQIGKLEHVVLITSMNFMWNPKANNDSKIMKYRFQMATIKPEQNRLKGNESEFWDSRNDGHIFPKIIK